MSPAWEQVAYPIRRQAEANGIPGMHLCPGKSTILGRGGRNLRLCRGWWRWQWCPGHVWMLTQKGFNDKIWQGDSIGKGMLSSKPWGKLARWFLRISWICRIQKSLLTTLLTYLCTCTTFHDLLCILGIILWFWYTIPYKLSKDVLSKDSPVFSMISFCGVFHFIQTRTLTLLATLGFIRGWWSLIAGGIFSEAPRKNHLGWLDIVIHQRSIP